MDIYVVHDDQGAIVAAGTSQKIISGEIELATTSKHKMHVVSVDDAPTGDVSGHLRKLMSEHRLKVESGKASLVRK